MNIEKLLIVDTETSGLDPSKDVVLEIGAVLWSIPHATTIACWSALIHHETHPTNGAEQVNRIPAAALPLGLTWDQAKTRLRSMANAADVIVAHRAEFDSAFLPSLDKPWVCSKFDWAWPHAKLGDGLVHIALANGIGVASAHRALTDCMLLARLFERAVEQCHDVAAMVALGLRPKATFQALVSFDDKDKAKDAGFQWVTDKKQWVRRMAIEDAAALPFKVREIEAA